MRLYHMFNPIQITYWPEKQNYEQPKKKKKKMELNLSIANLIMKISLICAAMSSCIRNNPWLVILWVAKMWGNKFYLSK